jgi:hypothetical protein
MKICESHWEKLRAAIKVRGIYDLVSDSGEEAIKRTVEVINGVDTVENFDPLLSANYMICGNALSAGGLYLMGVDESGKHYCPLCEAEKHQFTNWIDKAADAAAAHAKLLQGKREASP